MKRCTKCGLEKPLEDFHRATREGDGHRARCKTCVSADNRAYAAANPEAVREMARLRARAYFERNRALVNERGKRWRAANPAKIRESIRRSELKSKYGMTLEDYETLLAAQGGTCANPECGATVADSRGYPLHVDHCHKTERVRGLLCASCNIVIGRLGENPHSLRALADYLEAA